MDIDCNNCQHIDFTEYQQREENILFKKNVGHNCGFYDKILRHNSQDKNAIKIYPCKECNDERNINYMKIDDLIENLENIKNKIWQC